MSLQVDRLTGWQVDKLTDWQIDRFIGWQLTGTGVPLYFTKFVPFLMILFGLCLFVYIIQSSYYQKNTYEAVRSQGDYVMANSRE